MTLHLRSYQFRREREAGWRELEDLLARIDEVGVRALRPAQLSRLPVLYRSALSSLSVARAISLDRNLLSYLESLAERAHFSVYGVRQHLREQAREFVTRRFPRAVRAARWQLGLAAFFLALGVATAGMQVLEEPERFGAFVSPAEAQGRDPSSTTAELRDVLYGTHGQESFLGEFASFLFTHNAGIGILSFALGFAAGLPTFLLTFINGMMLGAFAALYHSRGLSFDFWGWILPHGVSELLALLLCAAGGLVIAESLIFPGRHTRLANLTVRGREAGTIVLGAVGLFLIAGLIEGIFRQLVFDPRIRYAVAGSTALFWLMYFTLAGRE